MTAAQFASLQAETLSLGIAVIVVLLAIFFALISRW